MIAHKKFVYGFIISLCCFSFIHGYGICNDKTLFTYSNSTDTLSDDYISVSVRKHGVDSLLTYIEWIIERGNEQTIDENYDQAISGFLEASNLLDRCMLNYELDDITVNNITRLYAKVKQSIAKVYSDIKSHELALEYYEDSFEDYKNINSTQGMESSLNGIGLSLKYLGLLDKSVKIYDSLFNISKKAGDSLMMAVALNNKGLALIDMQSFYASLVVFNRAIDIYKKCDDRKMEAASYFNLGVAQGRLGNYDSIPYYYSKSYEILKDIMDTSGMIRIQIELAQYAYSTGNYQKSLAFLDSAMKKAKSINSKEFISNMYNYYSEIYSATGDYKKALHYQKMYNSKRDSLFRLNKDRIAKMRIEYETSKRDRINELLKTENQLNELRIRKHTQQRIFFIALIILVLILILVLYSRFRLKIKTNRYLARQKKQLETANATKEKFISIIAHDLKNPLAATRTLIRSLADHYNKLSESKKKSYISNIDKSVDLTFSLLENLLTWSLLQKGDINYNPEPICLNDVVDSSMDLMKINAQKKEIVLVKEIPENTWVRFDRHMLAFIIRNLLTNAIKYSNRKGEVKIRGTIKGKIIELAVIDYGVGMDPETTGKLFRIDKNISTEGTDHEIGTGLGLILCKEFSDKNGSKISVQSSKGKGSIFTFTLEIINSYETNKDHNS